MRRVRALPLCLATLLTMCSAVDAEQAPKAPPSPKAQTNRPTKPKPASPPPATASKPHPVIPEPEVLLRLIRTTLVALDQANKTNNYTVLREIGGPSLQRFMSAQLGELFADLRTKGIDLSPTVVVTPQMFAAPVILSNGMLRLSGYFPTQPMQINFDLLFEETNSSWKLAGLRVSAVQSNGQSAPPTDVAPPAKQGQ
ncbi:MAG: hypothetical protein JSR99_19615 [Proteobacteria bacterium]|nr:hypothetical protein [Pseudomonadota bacterium]